MKLKDILPKESIAFQAVSASYFDPEKQDLTYLMSTLLECNLDPTDMFGIKVPIDSVRKINNILVDPDPDDLPILQEVVQDIIKSTENTFETEKHNYE